MSVTVDPPAVLPVRNLSLTSMNLLRSCPEAWHRKYILAEYEPPSGKMILGSSFGAAEGQHYSNVIETGEGYSLEQVEDEFSAEWEDRVSREEVDWGTDQPGDLKDSGIAVIERYHTLIAPSVVPVSVEREFQLTWPGLEWGLNGFLDLEEADGSVSDLKMKGKKVSQWEADRDLQPPTYLYARRAEGNPAAQFRFHVGVRTKLPYAEVVTTTRTDLQLDALADRVFAAANEIAWRAENEVWTGADPGSWKCSPKFCGYWSSCRFGGLR